MSGSHTLRGVTNRIRRRVRVDGLLM